MQTEFQPCEQDTAKTEKTTTIDIDISTFPSQAVFADDSDFEIADQFIVTQGRNWRYVAKWNKWLYWDGRWVIAEKLEHMTAINTIVAEASRQSDKNLKSAAKSHAVCTVAMSRQEIAAYPDEFDANQWLLGCNDITVNLKTGKKTPAHRDDLITKSCLAAPEQHSCPRWLQFLDNIFECDADVISFIQRVCGYALTGSTKEQKLFFLYGTGKNGKGTFLNTLSGILGDYARTASASLFLDSKYGEHATGLAGLSGARVVVSGELPAGKAWNEPTIKDMTSSDTLTARFMRGNFFDFKPTWKLFIQGNHQPTFRSVDEAIRRRVVLIPFTVTISPEKLDLNLEEKLGEEWNGILSWMLDGCLEWQESGLMIPEVISKASEDYMEAEDTVGQFLEDCTVQEGRILYSDLFHKFNGWQKGLGVSNTWTQTAMTRAIKERGYEEFRKNGGRGFIGLRLREADRYPNKRTDDF
jgi:putative DNA primase/helicase